MTLVSEHQDAEIGELKARIAVLEEQVGPPGGKLGGKGHRYTRNHRGRGPGLEIVDLFAGGETLHYSDISERLSIDLEMVVENLPGTAGRRSDTGR